MAEKRKLVVKKLGRLEYGAALSLQKETELAVKRAGRQTRCCSLSIRTR